MTHLAGCVYYKCLESTIYNMLEQSTAYIIKSKHKTTTLQIRTTCSTDDENGARTKVKEECVSITHLAGYACSK